MGNSLMIACAKMGLHFTACAPDTFFPDEALVKQARDIAKETGGSITLTERSMKALPVPTSSTPMSGSRWASQKEVWESRIKLLHPYQVNADVMAKAKPTALFMHDLPSFHNTETGVAAAIAEKFGLTEMEVTDEVFESPRSIVFDEAENRMHTIKAVIYATLK